MAILAFHKLHDSLLSLLKMRVFSSHSYLVGFIKEGLHTLGQSSDQCKGVSKHVQAQHKYIRLFDSLESTKIGIIIRKDKETPGKVLDAQKLE